MFQNTNQIKLPINLETRLKHLGVSIGFGGTTHSWMVYEGESFEMDDLGVRPIYENIYPLVLI